jgi:hypothetical protein
VSTEHPGLASVEYARLIEEQLAEERSTKLSLEGRGITVITTSGTMVGVLFALLAFANAAQVALSGIAQWLIAAAVILLVGSAVLGLRVNRPRTYDEMDPGSMESILLGADGEWGPDLDESRDEGVRRVAQLHLEVLKNARQANGEKAKLLIRAQGGEVFGIVLLGIAILVVLAHGVPA